MTIADAGILDVIVTDTRDDAAETYLNQLAFSYMPNANVIIRARRPDGSVVTYEDGTDNINVRFVLYIIIIL